MTSDDGRRRRTFRPPQVSRPRSARLKSPFSSVTRRTSPGQPQEKVDTRPRVLIVDDDEPIRKLLSRVAERSGFASDLCRDGGEAIQQLGAAGEDAYRYILLDLMMPGINGFEFIDHLKKHQPELLDRVIVLTASPRIDDERIARERIRGVMHKPFDINELTAVLK